MPDSDSIFMWSIIAIGLCALLALIPSGIAKKKGYRAGLWWLYGFFLWIVAVIHASLLPDQIAIERRIAHRNDTPSYLDKYMSHGEYKNYYYPKQNSVPSQKNDADEIMKYKKLLDEGAITQEEYDAKKKQILKI